MVVVLNQGTGIVKASLQQPTVPSRRRNKVKLGEVYKMEVVDKERGSVAVYTIPTNGFFTNMEIVSLPTDGYSTRPEIQKPTQEETKEYLELLNSVVGNI